MQEQITSLNNNHVKYIKKLLVSSKFRRKENKFVIEGVRLSFDAFKSGVKILRVFCTLESVEKYERYLSDILKKADVTFVSDGIIKHMTNTESPQGVVCVCEIENKTVGLCDFAQRSNKIIALENIQDPSNLGTILRTAEALGIDGVIASDDSCDLYNPKVLRGSMGAAFRIPYLVVQDFESLFFEIKDIGFETCATVPSNDADNLTHINFNLKSLVFIGNEGNGLTQNTIDSCDRRITIPMRGRAESLNAASAATIIMWEMVKNR